MKLPHILDPADLRESGYVDRLAIHDGLNPEAIPWLDQLRRYFWYRQGWRIAEKRSHN